MGLDCSHDAFHGAYSAFNRLRQEIARAIGGSYSPHNDPSLDYDLWYWGDGYNKKSHPGLHEFFCHSDCDGEIAPEMCILVADELEAILPNISSNRQSVQNFIDGCRRAAAANEPLLFR